MTAPKWITRQLVEFIHEAVIEMGGGAYVCATLPYLSLPLLDCKTSTLMVK